MEKLEWCKYPMVKKKLGYGQQSFVLTQYKDVTDGQTYAA